MTHVYDDKKRPLRIALLIAGIVLIGLAICLEIEAYRLERSLYFAEFNAQIAANGIYKEDLHILNQYNDRIKCNLIDCAVIFSFLSGAIIEIINTACWVCRKIK